MAGAMFASALSMSACTVSDPTGAATTVSSFITAVQATAKAACAVVPAATAIAQIWASNNPALATADAVATAICAAVNAAPATAVRMKAGGRLVPAPVTVDGIVVNFI